MSSWHLYWVESDGLEDCFVVARNSRSACRIERDMNGFGPDQVSAQRIARIPLEAQKSYEKTDIFKERGWPWYAFGKQLFEDLGAEFRTIDQTKEMLLEEVVYEIHDYRPTEIRRSYSIGFTAIEEFNGLEGVADFPHDDEDIWDGPEIHIVTALGMMLIRCQQIEDYIAKSFILAISDKQKRKYETIEDIENGWRKKTLGNLIRCIEEGWEIDPFFKQFLDFFVQNRNMVIHDIAVSDRYDITTS